MKNTFRLIFAATILALMTGTASAQSFRLGLGVLSGIPTGEFADSLDRIGWGISADAGYHFGQIPLEVGLRTGIVTYGNEKRQEPWSTTIPDVVVDVTTSNNIALFDGYLRLMPATGIVRPFLEGQIGLNYLFTSTSVSSRGGEDNDIASSTNYDDVAFSYGGSAGAAIELWRREPSDTSDASSVTLDLRGGYRYGEPASYLTSGSVRRQNGAVSYAPRSSRTDMFTAQIGVSVVF